MFTTLFFPPSPQERPPWKRQGHKSRADPRSLHRCPSVHPTKPPCSPLHTGFSCREKDPVMGFQPVEMGKEPRALETRLLRALGPSCAHSQVWSGCQGQGAGSRRQMNSVETLRLGVSVTPKFIVFPAHIGTGDRRLQKKIQEGPSGNFSRLCGVTCVISCKDPLQVPI